jgi:hypothetical protein
MHHHVICVPARVQDFSNTRTSKPVLKESDCLTPGIPSKTGRFVVGILVHGLRRLCLLEAGTALAGGGNSLFLPVVPFVSGEQGCS